MADTQASRSGASDIPSASESDHGGDLAEWRRHPDLYMPDGTVVLCADNTVFRVYSGLMSKHSDVFSGMASLSGHQPSNAEIYDGCPVVRLTDNAEDLAYFLETTMGVSYFHANQPTSFRIAAALLRLATKYMVPVPRRLAIEHFSRVIPNSIDEIGQKESFKQVFGLDAPHPFALVTLFRECQVTRFLPWAFYAACKEGFRKLVDGAPHGEGSIRLSDEDNRAALLGWNQLQYHTLKIRRTTVMSMSPNCESDACNASLRLEWLDTVFYHVDSSAAEQWGIFKMLGSSGRATMGSQNLQDITPCEMCVASWLEKEHGHRAQVWNELPKYFGLPPWESFQQD